MTHSASSPGSRAELRASSFAVPAPGAQRAALAGILVPGLVGLGIVARTLAFYAGGDWLATLLVLAIGVGLALGLVELVLRSRRALALGAELASLPPALEEGHLERLSPALRQLLRARVEHAPLAARDESVVPYLVGLLVMLGLLGTVLGLFETLGGASRALIAAGDVDALRGGLSGPLRGLTRSFGCSAAGVSASAMLGLAAALVRRREARLSAAVYAYADSALQQLSPLRRQAGALEKLAQQGDALPRAACALELAAERVSGLAERWEVAHRAATAAQHQALEQAVRSLRGELSQAALGAGRDLQASLAQQVERMVQRTGQTLAEHFARSAQIVEQDAAARREGDAALRGKLEAELETLRASLEQDVAARREGDTALRDKLQAELEILRASLTQDAAARREGDAALRDKLQAELEILRASLTQDAAARREGDAALRDKLQAELEILRASLTQDAAAQREADRVLRDTLQVEHEALRVALERGAAQQAELARAQLSALDAASQRLGQLAERVGEQLSMPLTVVAQLSERSQHAMALLEQSGSALEGALARHDHAVETLVGVAREQLARLQETAAEGTLAAVERVVSLSNEQAERLARFEAQLQAAQQGHGQELSAQLRAHAADLGRGLEGTGALVRDAANLLKASSVELGAVGEAFARSVEQQREAASTWLESLGELEGAVERAGRGAAADALGDQLASTQEVFARQLQFQRELSEQLRSLRTPPSPPAHGEHDVSA
jgi:hypothetical protein